MLRAMPVKGDPNVVGTPSAIGTPVWVTGHGATLGEIETTVDELEAVVVRGVNELTAGADGSGLKATDGGLRPPPPSSVEPSGIPTMPTEDPGPMDPAIGGNAVADATQVPGALVAIPPPSKSIMPDSPGIELPAPADAPVVKPAIPADAPVSGLPMPSGDGDEAPPHIAPMIGDAPEVVGLRPGVASSMAPMGIPVCPTGAFGMPSGDVMPSAGRGKTFMRACAWAEPQHKRTAAVRIVKRVTIGSNSRIVGRSLLQN